MKKQVFAAFTALALVMLSACGGTDKSASDAATVTNNIAAAPVDKSEKLLDMEIKDSGYSVSNGYMYYSINIYNPNAEAAIEYPTFRVTAKDSAGVLLGTTEQTLSLIRPGQEFWYGSQAFEIEETPATVEFEIVPPDEYNVTKESALEHPKYVPLTVENAVQRDDRFMGEVKNDNDYNIESGIVTVVFRDDAGKLIGGYSTFLDQIAASSTAPFDMSMYSDYATPNFEVYANVW